MGLLGTTQTEGLFILAGIFLVLIMFTVMSCCCCYHHCRCCRACCRCCRTADIDATPAAGDAVDVNDLDEDVANAIRKQLGHPDFLDTTNGGDGGEGGLKVMDTTATETSTDDECSSDATTASGAGSSATDAEAASNSSVPTATSST